MRLAAAESLAEKKEPSCAPLLIERAEHPDPFVQAAALRALRELTLPDALAAALRALRSAAPEVRREGLGVIGWLKAEEAMPALIATASDEDPSVRRATMSALVFVRPGGPGASTLVAGLSDPHWQVREEAAVSAAKIRLPEATVALIAAMTDEVWQVRIKAANALGRLRAESAIEALGEALGSEISNLRKESAAALGEIAAPRALNWLEPAWTIRIRTSAS
ncbi:HEAT repeat domain-containing protein [Chenggangzhangella methanolivorans]|uniref:HEAT repeat domain-containing protein n=1 Tax=Chenggangzhangella methanolivorans TaxID=1437009 RepID=UPI0032047E60